MAPLAYAQLQVLEQAVKAPGSVQDELLSEYCRTNVFETVIGSVRFGKDGEWEKPRVVQVQFQHINNNEVDSFRDSSAQVVVSSDEYASGALLYPYARNI